MIPTPYRSFAALESAAETLIRKAFGADYLKTPQRVNIDRIVEFYFGINLDYRYLSPDGNTLGMTVYTGGTVDTYSSDGVCTPSHYTHDTILLDLRAMESLPESRMRFTLAHECGHYALHKNEISSTTTQPGNAVVSKFQISTSPNLEFYNNKTQQRQEIQANCFGVALLMPKTPFSLAYHELIPQGWDSLTREETISAIQELSTIFGTSLEATAYRIKDLRLAA